MPFIIFTLIGLISTSQVNLKQDTTILSTVAESENPNYSKAIFPNNDCTVQTCYNGKCISPSICLCDPYYADFPSNSLQTEGTVCMYKRKSWVLIFLIELIIGNGIGHMIAGNTIYGILKLFCGLTGCVSKIIVSCMSKDTNGGKIAAFGCCICLMLCVYCIWCIADICIFLFRVYRDGNGVTVY